MKKLTIDEFDAALQTYCGEQDVECEDCPLREIFKDCDALERNYLENYDEVVKIFAEHFGWEDEPDDVVNHPSHYTDGGMECIDEMLLVFGEEVVKNFCLCNVWKYRRRALLKNGIEDLEKSHWYMNKYKELCEKQHDLLVRGF